MSKMKFKVGDKVRVRQWEAMLRGNKLVCDSISFLGNHFYFPRQNKRLCGQIVTIKEVKDDYYHIEEDNGECCWIDEMFEGYAFEFGELIEVSQSGNKWEKRIYVGYIDGSDYPYICVYSDDNSLNGFKKGNSFSIMSWKYARPIPKKHTIIIDGVEIEISDKDYKALKEKLCKEK